MNSQDIRRLFLNYFQQQHHTIVPGSSLVPSQDATLLFTNAGMVQFKDVFLGLDHRPYCRAATSQPCLRAGGKHNDLENVGYTARHHTFFEMLGNFSFGDYFKREAIHLAWRFLTEQLALPKERLWVTVYEQDDEAADIWLKEIGVDPNRLSRIGAKDNFWSMGDTGPCGPCSEIFYDHGPEIWGGPPGSAEEDGDRYIEIWNLVFMQYNREVDGTLTPLPKPSVDTGMGLERLAAVLQGVHNNYDTDLFQPLIKATAQLAGCTDLTHKSLRVISDHVRASVFLIADGVRPFNEGRGYVLRRIIRRALRHGHQLGLTQAFFYRLVPVFVAMMTEAYPQLKAKQADIEQVLQQEEQQFARTLAQGLKYLEEAMAMLGPENCLRGEVVFKLYDTYGFPSDLTADMAREKGLSIDDEGFQAAMQRQRDLSKAASKFSQTLVAIHTECRTDFIGYEHLVTEAPITALYHQQQPVTVLEEGQEGVVVLSHSPFYAESGGQVGDRGVIRHSQGEFVVTDTRKLGSAIAHHGHVRLGRLSVNTTVAAMVDEQARQATALNHSATHLLHKALQCVVGPHVEQKGSLVEPERLRFDFTHAAAVTKEQWQAVEAMVNAQIRANHPIVTELMTPSEAVAQGAMALFGEKYGEVVRVLSMGDFSKELCGGTHAQRTGDIGLFKLISESGISAGVRRIEAITGEAALHWVKGLENQWLEAANLLKTNTKQVLSKIEQLLHQDKQQQKQLEQWQHQMVSLQSQVLLNQVDRFAQVSVLVAQVTDTSPAVLKALAEYLRDRLASAMVVLLGVSEQRVHVVGVASKDCMHLCPMGPLVQAVAAVLEGKGGGRADFAQASGVKIAAMDQALALAKAKLSDALMPS